MSGESGEKHKPDETTPPYIGLVTVAVKQEDKKACMEVRFLPRPLFMRNKIVKLIRRYERRIGRQPKSLKNYYKSLTSTEKEKYLEYIKLIIE